MRWVKKILLAVIVVYLGVIAYCTYYQRDLIYFPTKTLASLAAVGAEETPFKELEITTEDGLDLKGWYAPAVDDSMPTIIFFHGNADKLQSTFSIATPYVEAGYGFLLTEYRGYSGMPGKPNENGLYADARGYISKLFDQKDISIDAMIFMGHSLGAGVATQMAREFQPKGLVLLAPFLSIAKLAKLIYPYLPTEFLVADRFANDEKLPTMRTPLLIIYGDRDKLIPPLQGKKLFEMAQEPKTESVIEGFGHNDLFEQAAPVVMGWLDGLKEK